MRASHSQDLLVDNGGYGLLNETCVGFRQKPQQPNSQHQPSQVQHRLRYQNMFLDIDNSLQPSMFFSQNMVDEVTKQWQEIDQYFVSQKEKLRMVLLEQRKQRLSILLKKLESKSEFMLRQKDEQIAHASRKTMELEIFLTELASEYQAWQRLALEKEAMVTSLKNILEQMNEMASYESNNMAEDAESCFEVESAEREATEAKESRDGDGVGGIEQGRRKTMMMVCKICKCRRSCIVFLPCKHLSSCKACEPLLEACPVCRIQG